MDNQSKTDAKAATANSWVRFDRKQIAAIGPYKPGIAYEVAAGEAKRLVDAKGFTYTTPPGAAPQAAAPEIPAATKES